MKRRSSPIARFNSERPVRCPICEAKLGGNEMGLRSHLRRHLRELGTDKLDLPHTVFLQFLGMEYWRTSIFEDYAKKYMASARRPHERQGI
jgi:hypothetical protein